MARGGGIPGAAGAAGGGLGGKALTPAAKASLTTALAGTNNDLVFTAKTAGYWGNAVRVRYVDPGGVSATLGVVVSGNDITVNLGRAASLINTTATALKAAIDGNTSAAALVDVANAGGNDGSGLVTALAYTALAGGSNRVREQGTGYATDTKAGGQV
jgi:hypothetical protein